MLEAHCLLQSDEDFVHSAIKAWYGSTEPWLLDFLKEGGAEEGRRKASYVFVFAF